MSARIVANGKSGSWSVTRRIDDAFGPAVFVVRCHGIEVLASCSIEDAWARARARSGYDVSQWHVEETCKRCEAWHESGVLCSSCEARRANES